MIMEHYFSNILTIFFLELGRLLENWHPFLITYYMTKNIVFNVIHYTHTHIHTHIYMYVQMVWTIPTRCLEKRWENPDWNYSINRRECWVVVHRRFIHRDWAPSSLHPGPIMLPFTAAHSARPWTRRTSHPCAWCSLCSSHGPPVCVCDRAITAQHGLRDSPHPPPPNPQHHHRPGHLLFNLTRCAGKYSRNGQSNDRSWCSLQQKQLWGFFAIMILPGSAAKMLITLDANPHTFGHLCLSATQECL